MKMSTIDKLKIISTLVRDRMHDGAKISDKELLRLFRVKKITDKNGLPFNKKLIINAQKDHSAYLEILNNIE